MRVQGVLGESITDEHPHGASFDASITFGDITLTRTREGRWMIDHGDTVDLAQLEAAAQWAMRAPLALPNPSPAVTVMDGADENVVTAAQTMLSEQGSFGTTDGGGGPIVTSSWDTGGDIDIEGVRAVVIQASFDTLTTMCETACGDKNAAGMDVLEMALEERVAKMLRDAAEAYGCVFSSNDEIRHMTYEHAKEESIDGGRGWASEADWNAQHKQLVNDVEYLEDVRGYIRARRQHQAVRVDAFPGGDWSAWRAHRVSSRAAAAVQRAELDREQEELAGEWPDTP